MRVALGFVLLAVVSVTAQQPVQQQPPPQLPRIPVEWRGQAVMAQIASALGVTCEYCHAPASERSPGGAPKRAIARQMIFMVDEINARIPAVTGKVNNEAAVVTCVTCHRGVIIPNQLSEIVVQTTLLKSVEDAVAQYRELRARYFGRGGYDFGEEELITAGMRLTATRPDAAVVILTLNLEFYPRSVRTYVAMAQAHTRRFDDPSAITALEKALEIEPDNGPVQGQLTQLRRLQRR